MREEVKLEAAMEKATSWPRSSTSSRPHTSFLLNSMSPSTEASDQISCGSKIYTAGRWRTERGRRPRRRMKGGQQCRTGRWVACNKLTAG